MRIVGYVGEAALQDALANAAARLGAEVVSINAGPGAVAANTDQLLPVLRTHPNVLLFEVKPELLPTVRNETRARGISLVAACHGDEDVRRAVRCGVDDWLLLPASADEVHARLLALGYRSRASGAAGTAAADGEMADHLRYEELLYDRYTGFPTLPVMLERGRELLERRGRMTVLYIEFVRYSKLEEIYGWEKLDAVLQSTAAAVRDFYDTRTSNEENMLMVSHTGDDDFIFFTDLPDATDHAERRINEIAHDLEEHVRTRIEAEHGEDVAGLFEIYVGSTTLFRNPKIRPERIIYRGIREAAAAARGVESRERSRKVADLKETIREGAVYIVYHPIVVTETKQIYGYEALARGTHRALRSPEVMFGVAEEANLIWELSRLCRRKAVEGMNDTLTDGQYLFLNIDPHDFRDPSFRYFDEEDMNVSHPERIVLEITERTAITDYPTFQGYLKAFRERGFRFAVDDAGSGYAGLGSIANLEPDFIKLDISLISGIDTNFMKQNLVETMVQFANDHGIKVIAEGVERQEEYETVKQIGVHLTQGFYFHNAQHKGAITAGAHA
ncbi:MAG TPA: EAL domain-containing protein [Longimicrobium sp.]|nr:EAL domain-containing protein [Longimicrobium sp.]